MSGAPAAVPIEAQIACVEREIRMRERAYPRWVAVQRITQRNADSEIAAMRAVLETLRRLQPAQTAQPSLLGRRWRIWVEGYRATGDSATASFVGEADGATFEEAVRAWYEAHPSSSFDTERLTLWGCRHFPSETLARVSFG